MQFLIKTKVYFCIDHNAYAYQLFVKTLQSFETNRKTNMQRKVIVCLISHFIVNNRFYVYFYDMFSDVLAKMKVFERKFPLQNHLDVISTVVCIKLVRRKVYLVV